MKKSIIFAKKITTSFKATPKDYNLKIARTILYLLLFLPLTVKIFQNLPLSPLQKGRFMGHEPGHGAVGEVHPGDGPVLLPHRHGTQRGVKHPEFHDYSQDALLLSSRMLM